MRRCSIGRSVCRSNHRAAGRLRSRDPRRRDLGGGHTGRGSACRAQRAVWGDPHRRGHDLVPCRRDTRRGANRRPHRAGFGWGWPSWLSRTHVVTSRSLGCATTSCSRGVLRGMTVFVSIQLTPRRGYARSARVTSTFKNARVCPRTAVPWGPDPSVSEDVVRGQARTSVIENVDLSVEVFIQVGKVISRTSDSGGINARLAPAKIDTRRHHERRRVAERQVVATNRLDVRPSIDGQRESL